MSCRHHFSRSRTLAFTALAVSCLVASPQAVLAQSCPVAPPAVRNLEMPRYYSDAAGTVIDPVLKAQYDARVAPLVAFVANVAKQADAALKAAKPDNRRASAVCAVEWLEAWARAGAWLGPKVTQQGEYQRKWDMTGVALAYLKVREAASTEQRRAIEGWLKRLATASRAFFDNPERKRNNHWYWLGLGLGAIAIATEDERLWLQARGIAEDAAHHIRGDGALPMEIERGTRALHYHAFSLMPLVVLAELAALRGEDFYALKDGALGRLAALTLKGFDDPETFNRLAGARQVIGPSSPGAGWLQLYRARFPAHVAGTQLSMRSSDRRLGGEVELLLRHLRAGR